MKKRKRPQKQIEFQFFHSLREGGQMKGLIITRILQIILSFFSIIILDILWFSFTGKIYDDAFVSMNSEFNTVLETHLLLASLAVYTLCALAITFFALPLSEKMNYFLSFLWGGFLGLIIFGIYDFTNYMLLIKWPLRIVFLDMCWGFLVFGLTTVIVKGISSFIQRKIAANR